MPKSRGWHNEIYYNAETLDQYLRPRLENLMVERFVTSDEFKMLEIAGLKWGSSKSFVGKSYLGSIVN